ncbi:MAG: hypothetical protein J7L55_05075 [Desulfurococcales archaeon]|nr:hypothetical protein [Desulfurococcales archaeon]
MVTEEEATIPSEEEEVEEEQAEKATKKLIEGEEERPEEEAPEEYIPAEEEVEALPPGAFNVRAIEIMADISDLIMQAVDGAIPLDEAVKRVSEARSKLIVRVRHAGSSKTGQSKRVKKAKKASKKKK